MEYQTLEYTVDQAEQCSIIRLDRPEKLNAISYEMVQELSNALESAEADEGVRAVIITGNGEAFSSGFEFSDEDVIGNWGDPKGSDGSVPSADDLVYNMDDLIEHVYKIWDLKIPVIAAVNGHCLAGGGDIAMISDIVIASEEATFGYPGQRIAGHPPTLSYPFFMHPHEAKELLLTGKTVDAERAKEMGIFTRVVPHDELLDEAFADVEAIRKIPTTGTYIVKRSINNTLENQGLMAAYKNSGFLDSLAHLTDMGKEYYRIRHSVDELDELYEWMNDTDK